MALSAVALMLLAAGLVAQVAVDGDGQGQQLLPTAMTVLTVVITLAVGLVITVRRPENRLGWIIVALALIISVQQAVTGYVATQPAAGSLLTAVLWFDGRSFLLLWACLIGVFFLFPDGHLPSGRWRPVAVAAAAAVTAGVILQAVSPGPLREGLPTSPSNPLNPIGLPAPLWDRVEFLTAFAFVGLAASLVASVASLVARYRASGAVQRLQIRWVVTASGSFAVVLLANVAVRHLAPAYLELWDVITGLVFTLIPISVGVAVLRYRLYEIDRVINRTIVYGAVTIVLAGAYAVAVTAVRTLTQPWTGDAAVAVAASTLVVAALFQPVRRRIQSAVDRRFNRARYDAAATIHRFSGRLRDEVDLATLHDELLAVVATTMQPSTSALWLREASR